MSRRQSSWTRCLLAAWLFTGAAPAVASSDEAPRNLAPSTAGPDAQTIVAGMELDRGGKWRV